MIAVAAAGWYLFAPASPPQCDDADVQKTLRASMFTSRIQQMSRNPLAGGAAPADLYLATFADVKEVGYIKPERSRGCTATLKVGEATSSLAYTIGPNAKGEMMIAGADPRVVRARYGQLDASGKPRDVGQPAGAVRLAAAFEQGVAAFDQTTRGEARKAAYERQRQRVGLPPETDTRTVRNVQPLGDCKELEAANGRAACRPNIATGCCRPSAAPTGRCSKAILISCATAMPGAWAKRSRASTWMRSCAAGWPN
ncbi:hypothetical protein WJ966_16720 [Achromobacter xylosoxidans]